MKKIFIALLLLGVYTIAKSQTITINDKETGEPLEAVSLLSTNPRAFAVTDANGQADISAFKDVERIEIQIIGYKLETKSYKDIETTSFKLSLSPSTFNLEGVVVSATRWSQNTGNVPSKIISITLKEVSLQNPQTAADLLGGSGNVFIQKSQQGGGSPMIRGFATNRLLYTVDGVRMNTTIFRSGNLQNIINLDPFATENAEVLFGPGSVIYGSDAIGGVMSFQTLTPKLSLADKPLITGNVTTRYSSANKEKTGHFDVNVGWKKWALVTSFSSWDFDHLKQGSNGPDDYIKDYHPQRQDSTDVLIAQDDPLLQIPSAYSQKNLMQKVRFKPNNNWDFQYGFHFSETSSYGRYDRHNRTKNGTARYAEWYYGPQKWMMNNLSVRHLKSNVLYDQFTLRLTQQSFEESRINRSLNRNTRKRRVENVETYSANLDFIKNTGNKNTLYYGVEYVTNDVESNGTEEILSNNITEPVSIIDGENRYPQATWSSIAAYINDEYRFLEKFILQAGLRYNQYIVKADFSENQNFFPLPFTEAEINKGSLTGSIGVVYRPSKSWVIKTNFGTAFRSPNVDDIGKIFDSEPGSVVVPNPDLEAEYAYNFDLGITKIFGDVIKVDLTGYYTIMENALVRRDYQLNGLDSIVYDGELSQVQAIQNAASANVYGLQAGIEVKLPLDFTFSSNLNYQMGEEELDDGSVSTSRHAAPLFGISRLRYHNNNLSLEINSIYQGKRSHGSLSVSEQGKDEIYAHDKNGNTYSPSWYTLNIKALYQLTNVIRVSGGIENLTNQRYRPYSSGLSGAGRNFILSLNLNF